MAFAKPHPNVIRRRVLAELSAETTRLARMESQQAQGRVQHAVIVAQIAEAAGRARALASVPRQRQQSAATRDARGRFVKVSA